MKKLKMIVTSVILLAIVGSGLAFNAKKKSNYCTSGSVNSTTCNTISSTTNTLKRVSGTQTAYYVVDWDGGTCSQTCTTSARFEAD